MHEVARLLLVLAIGASPLAHADESVAFSTTDPHAAQRRTIVRLSLPVGPQMSWANALRLDVHVQRPVLEGPLGIGWYATLPIVAGHVGRADPTSGTRFGDTLLLTSLELGALVSVRHVADWTLHAGVTSPKLTNLETPFAGGHLASLTQYARPAEAASVLPGAFLRTGLSAALALGSARFQADLDVDFPFGLTSVDTSVRLQGGAGLRTGAWTWTLEAAATTFDDGAAFGSAAVSMRHGDGWLALAAPLAPSRLVVAWAVVTWGIEL